MNSIKIPTSKDIFIEVNGQRIAVIESYKATSQRKLCSIEEYNSLVPAATFSAKELHELELKRVYFIESSKLDFQSLSDFSVVIVKPDSKILYSSCEWESISEFTDINSPCIETMKVISRKRSVI